MKYSGRARKAAFKLIFFCLIAGCVIWVLIFVGSVITSVISLAAILPLIILWLLFSVFTLYFFRDPNPRVPAASNVVLSPAHGKVDVIDSTVELLFMGGECQRVSIFLSVIDVHVQNAPVTGKIALFKYTIGQFLNALRTESAIHNENVLLGFEASDPPDRKIGVRLIAGVIARRIVPFAQQGDLVTRGDRICLIQFGSRADVYLPLDAKIKVKLGDHVVGGETIVAAFE
jgi:phosphatidylserine decarboxylase